MTEKELEKQKYQQRQFAYDSALRISEVYPNVKLITIRYEGKSMSFEANKTSGEQKYSPDMQNVFLVNCPNSSCTGIGFNMRPLIDDMVRKQENKKHGELECNEFEDAERSGKIHCRALLHYTIQIEYRS